MKFIKMAGRRIPIDTLRWHNSDDYNDTWIEYAEDEYGVPLDDDELVALEEQNETMVYEEWNKYCHEMELMEEELKAAEERMLKDDYRQRLAGIKPL